MNSFPMPPERYPFKPGEAVYHVTSTALSRPPTLTPAVVVAPQLEIVTTQRAAPRVSIVRNDGQQVRVKGSNLAYRGYCAACGVPAVIEGDRLVCPDCGDDATAVPPPDELTLRWYPAGHARDTQVVREYLLGAATYGAACEIRNRRHNDAFYGMIDKYGLRGELYDRRGAWARTDDLWRFMEHMQWLAELGDEAGFLACYKARGGVLPAERFERFIELLSGDGPGRPSQRLELPPLDVVRPVDDSEPDGADDLTAWLDRQFGHEPPAPTASVWRVPPWRKAA